MKDKNIPVKIDTKNDGIINKKNNTNNDNNNNNNNDKSWMNIQKFGYIAKYENAISTRN